MIVTMPGCTFYANPALTIQYLLGIDYENSRLKCWQLVDGVGIQINALMFDKWNHLTHWRILLGRSCPIICMPIDVIGIHQHFISTSSAFLHHDRQVSMRGESLPQTNKSLPTRSPALIVYQSCRLYALHLSNIFLFQPDKQTNYFPSSSANPLPPSNTSPDVFRAITSCWFNTGKSIIWRLEAMINDQRGKLSIELSATLLTCFDSFLPPSLS